MLFLVLLDYRRPLAEVDAHLEGHRAFLGRHYAAGHFLLSGRKTPRTGGVILARAPSPQALWQWLEEDPFFQARLADYQIVAWEPAMVARNLSPASVAAEALVLGPAPESNPHPAS